MAHRYDEVTVLQAAARSARWTLPGHRAMTCPGPALLQADMVGFTKLSSERSADFVLGLLSDLFAKFDGLAEGYGVHKVKTIGEQRSRPLRAARASGAHGVLHPHRR